MYWNLLDHFIILALRKRHGTGELQHDCWTEADDVMPVGGQEGLDGFRLAGVTWQVGRGGASVGQVVSTQVELNGLTGHVICGATSSIVPRTNS